MTRWFEVYEVIGTERFFGPTGEIVEARKARLQPGPKFRRLEDAWEFIEMRPSGRYVVRTPAGSWISGD